LNPRSPGLRRAQVGLRVSCGLADVDMDASDSAETLEKCTTIELRAILARSVALANRAQSALDRLTADVPWPSRLSPALVLAFLPLHELAPALRVSTVWRDQAEEVFRGIAARLRLGRSSPSSWREVVRNNAIFRWLPVAFSESFQPVQFDMDGMVSPRVIDCRYDNDTMYFGQGAAINDDEAIFWELKLGRTSEAIVDSCGLAIIDGDKIVDQAALDPNDVLHAYLWHSNGSEYRLEGPRASSFTTLTPLHLDDDEDIWDSDATVRVSAVRHGTGLRLHLVVLDEDNAQSPGFYRGHRRHSLEECPSRIRIAPFVSLYTGSRAELLRFRRKPAGLARTGQF
jgi:hypothetical protein